MHAPAAKPRTRRKRKPCVWLRHRLDSADQAIVLEWIRQHGLERIARIVAAVAETSDAPKLETLLLLKMAHLSLQQPDRTLHAIAVAVAKEAHPHRKRGARESLTSKLERDFRKQRHTWLKLARHTPVPDQADIAEDLRRPRPLLERRVLAQLVELLPSAIDLYDQLKRDAGRRGPEATRRVKALGRKKIEPLLTAALERPEGRPRNFFELIEPLLPAELDKKPLN